MKRNYIISLIIFCMTFGMLTTSCQDMLTPDSERQAYENSVAKDTLYSYWGIVKSLQNVAEKYVILNECRGDLVDGTGFVSDSIKAILNFGMGADTEKYYKDGVNAYMNIRDYYHIINSCNAYIALCDKDRMTGIQRTPYMLREYAQVLAIRAWVYMQLVNIYQRVPFYTKPMLTTDDINDFMTDGNTEYITAEELADKLAPELQDMYKVEFEFGFPQYNSYGVVHSSKLMFPIAIVLGDLYLMKGGNKDTYAQAAYWYYQFLNSKNGGVIRDATNYSIGDIVQGRDTPIYDWSTSSAFFSTGRSGASEEAITCIPSNIGKLEGKVNTDICRLFGFKPEIGVSHIKNDFDETDDDDNKVDDSEIAYIILTREYERELVPSRGYDKLCDDQNYEIYLGDDTEPYRELKTLEGVGDARRSWTVNGSQQFTFYVGDDTYYGKMVTKQCPGGGFSTTYPVLYRKATIWLRYAEALNRAGFPSYAFAILKSGLCNNTNWIPEADYVMSTTWDYLTGYYKGNYAPKAISYTYNDALNDVVVPAEGEPVITDIAELKAVVNARYQAIADEANAESGAVDGDDNYVIAEVYDAKNVKCAPYGLSNYPTEGNMAVCYYLSRAEVIDAKSTPYLNLRTEYLRGNANSKSYRWKENERSRTIHMTTLKNNGSGNPDLRVAMGIHQRGCGFILPYHSPELLSSYEYIPMVQKKIKEATGIDYTMEQIYDGRYDEYVVNAVEDLILDEMALELAFEGTRFTDLARIANRRGDVSFFANRVAKRSGEENAQLKAWLMDKNHWYLPLPKE